DQVSLERNGCSSGLCQRLLPGAHFANGVQPGVKANPRSGGTIALRPFARRVVDTAIDLEEGRIGLLTRLNRIASVDEESGAILQDNGGACRPGEGGDPGETFGAGGDVLTLVLISARHEKRIQPFFGHECTQPGKA